MSARSSPGTPATPPGAAGEGPVRVVLADDHPIVLSGLAEVLRASRDFTLVAVCADGKSAHRAIQRHRPDVAVLDIRMPGMTGLEVVRELRREELPTRVLLLTGDIDEDQTLEALRLGVHGVILKSMAAQMLVQGIKKVAGGGYWVERDSLRLAVEKLLRRETARAEGLLTASETRIVQLVSEGRRNADIAQTLHVSEGTVKTHLHNVYSKLDVKSRQELIERAREKWLV